MTRAQAEERARKIVWDRASEWASVCFDETIIDFEALAVVQASVAMPARVLVAPLGGLSRV